VLVTSNLRDFEAARVELHPKPAYTVVPADKALEEQKAAFARLRSKLGSASEEEVWKILDEREPAPTDSDEGWTPELGQAREERIAAARRSSGAS